MMTPFLSVTGGGDQENTTSLSPATAVNSTGEPDGAEREKTMTLLRLPKIEKLMVHT